MKTRIIAVILAMATLMGFSAAGAQANTYGLRWASRTVYVYVDSNVSSKWYLDADMAQWSAAGGIDIVRTTTSSKATVRVHQKDLPAPNAGQTSLAWSGSTLVSADITLDSTALSLGYCSRRHIATHELGHALGLDHNTSSKTSLMYVGSGAACSYYPSSYDYGDLRFLYPF